MLQKLRQWIRKLSFPISLLLMGVLFFTWTDNWQMYTDPLRELYNRGVQLGRRCLDGSYIGTRTTGREPYRGIRSRKAQKIPQGKVGHRQAESHRQIRRQRQ